VLRRNLGLAAGALIASVLCSAAGGQAQSGSQGAATRTAVVAPVAKGLSLSGAPLDPLAKGGTVVLIFVRTDCPVSNRYAPTLKAMSQEYKGKAQFVLVYPDKDETSATIGKHLQEYGYHFSALRDPQHELVKESKVQITPEVAVFNGKRELIYHGRIDNWYEDFGRARSQPTTHELNEAIRATVNGTPAPASVSGVGCYISDLQ
jgi:thiol-disulfide isomerase/thioredoxin